MGMRNIRLILQFEGTDFCGWQMQASDRTVQGDLAAALRELTGRDVVLHSSSRTDAGVHALAMPVSFRLDTTLPLKAFVLGLNSILAHDLRVMSAEDVPDDFHARFSARGKTYRYRVQNGRVMQPIERRTSWHVPVPIDIDALRAGAAHLLGEHDFSAFRAAGCDAASPVRTIRSVSARWAEPPGGRILEIEVSGDGFLRNMVRIVAGTLVAVGIGRRPPGWVRELLESRDRRQGGQTAPPRGLFLVEVEYP
ncbi:MAG: tRNA pseudouridine(38-40) synthase TruA [Deltaproteobacteria bacterium]|nr:tRNA pseudouridine(38-40) synthase TruA [Deltaproteobacteria bacterium]